MDALRDRIQARIQAERRRLAERAIQREWRAEHQRRLALGRAALVRHGAGAIITTDEREHLNFLRTNAPDQRERDAAYRAERAIQRREIRAGFNSAPAAAAAAAAIPAQPTNQLEFALPLPPGSVLSRGVVMLYQVDDTTSSPSSSESDRLSRSQRPARPGSRPLSHPEPPRRRSAPS